MLSTGTWILPGCFSQESGLKPEYAKKFLMCTAKQKLLQMWSQASPVCVPGLSGTYNPYPSADHGFTWSSLSVETMFYSTLRTSNRRP